MPDILKKSSFQLLLSGQCVSNIGEACRLVSVTLFLVKTTGSGVSAVFGLICAAIPGLILSPFAGAIGDLMPEKPLLAAADFIRAFLVLLFLHCTNVTGIYMLLIALSILDILCSPARRKFIVGIAGKKSILSANSLLTGASGVAFLAGPLLGGVMVDKFGSGPPFILNSLTYLFSGVTILLINYNWLPSVCKKRGIFGIEKLYSETLLGFTYFKNHTMVKKVVYICSLLGFGMVSMNLAFYPFAFDILQVTAKGWSLMLSIFYGTNLIAMAVVPLISRVIKNDTYLVIFILLGITALIWFLYSLSCNLAIILLLQFIEGSVLAVCGILLGTLLQTLPERNFIARVSGVSDLIGSGCKIAAMLFTYLVLKNFNYKAVFIFDSIVLFAFTVISLGGSYGKKSFHSM